MIGLVGYLAHPYNAPTGAERIANLANARKWLRFLVDATPLVVLAPWIPYVEELDEDGYRERGIRDQRKALERCDVLIATGGRISSGMRDEIERAVELEIPVLDLTPLGVRPPAIPPEHAGAMLATRWTALRRGEPRPHTIAEAVSWIAGYFDDLGMPGEATEIRTGQWRSQIAPEPRYQPFALLSGEQVALLRGAVHVVKSSPVSGAAEILESIIAAAEERLGR